MTLIINQTNLLQKCKIGHHGNLKLKQTPRVFNEGSALFSTKTGKANKPKNKSKLKKETHQKQSIKNVMKVKRTNPDSAHLNGLIKSVPITFSLILKNMSKEISLDTDKAIKQVIEFHDGIIKNNGVVEGTARFNKIRLFCILLLEGQNPEPLERIAVSHKYRWPSGLYELLPFYLRVLRHKCVTSDRIIRSILYLNRLCEGNGVIDTKTILHKYEVSSEFKAEFQEYLNKYSKILSADLRDLHAAPSTRVTSNGPNGKPKWQTAELEAYTLMNSEYQVHFHSLCEATENMNLYEYMKERASKQTRVDRKRLRYITSIRDSGNKSRLVAISDYWTQILLEPIMMDIQDFTDKRWEGVSYAKSHVAGFESFKKRIKPGDKSYDLTAWTDGLPAVLQRMFLQTRYGEKIANAWFALVVDCNWNIKGSKNSIKYGTGQGMGTAGSFDIATLTDLELLNMVYKRHYNKPISKHNTTKVGDDLVIHDPDSHIYTYYTVDLGMEINQSKTKTATDGNICGEFVSRNINYGNDVSRISANICRSVKNNILDLPQLSHHLQERGINILIPLPDIFSSLKIKGEHKALVLRTLYLLSLLNREEELGLLRKSLKEHYSDFIAADKILSVYGVNRDRVEEFRKVLMVYEVGRLLNSICDKLDLVMTGITDSEIDSSDILVSESELENLWSRKDDSIEYLTSIVILSRTFRSFKEMHKSDDFREISDIVDILSKTEQRMSFRELGVISTTGTVWRPKATRLFNFIRSLDSANPKVMDYVLMNIDRDKPQQVYHSLVSSNLLLPYTDPIFKGIELPKIGKVK